MRRQYPRRSQPKNQENRQSAHLRRLASANTEQFDRRLLPIVCTLYVLSYLDRGNIGNAKAAGAREDLGLSDSDWAWVLNAFYICYVTFEWTNLLWKLLPASKYVATLCVL